MAKNTTFVPVMSLIKILFNVLIIYGVWQLIKVAFTINNVKKEFRRNFEQMQQQQQGVNNTQAQARPKVRNNSLDKEGEYVDFEELK